MFTTRDVIKDAFNRSGIWTNATSPLPAQYSARGLDRLRGIIAYFNKQNFLTFSQKKVNASVAETLTIGVDDADRSVTNDIATASMPNSIQKVYYIASGTSNALSEINFVPFTEFELYSAGSPVYTYRQLSDLQFEMNFKSGYVGRPIVIHYNEGISVELDKSWALPDEMRELWTVGLEAKLLDDYPRLNGDTKKNSVALELQNMISAIAGSNGAARLDEFNHYGEPYSYARFLSGVDLYGGNV